MFSVTFSDILTLKAKILCWTENLDRECSVSDVKVIRTVRTILLWDIESLSQQRSKFAKRTSAFKIDVVFYSNLKDGRL